jgi:rubrerythrin
VKTSSPVEGEWQARVQHAFRSHVRSERQVIDDYGRLVHRTTDPGTRFLLAQILADERRHHELFSSMLAEGLAEGSEATPTIPVPHPAPDEAVELLESTSRFLAAEREDREQLRRLRRDLSAAGKDSVWPLVVELMEIDTVKHIRLLEELRARLHDPAGRILDEQHTPL